MTPEMRIDNLSPIIIMYHRLDGSRNPLQHHLITNTKESTGEPCKFDFAVFVTVKAPELVSGEGCSGCPITG